MTIYCDKCCKKKSVSEILFVRDMSGEISETICLSCYTAFKESKPYISVRAPLTNEELDRIKKAIREQGKDAPIVSTDRTDYFPDWDKYSSSRAAEPVLNPNRIVCDINKEAEK